MSNAQRQGITPIYVQNVLIQSNNISFGGATAFDLEADRGAAVPAMSISPAIRSPTPDMRTSSQPLRAQP